MSEQKNKIEIHTDLDKRGIPEKITWQTHAEQREVKAFLLSLWDKEEKSLYKIDLWTANMQKEEMLAFYQQTLMTLADTLQNATACTKTAGMLRELGKDFFDKGIEELKSIHAPH